MQYNAMQCSTIYVTEQRTIIPTAPLKITVNSIIYTCPSSANAPTKNSEHVTIKPSISEPVMIHDPTNIPRNKLISTILVVRAITKININGIKLIPRPYV